MAKLICKLEGVRGRSLEVYDTKCVIKTAGTVGNLLLGNATDGEKTIFYIDCAGVQFKESGVTIGYLQLETPSMQMNNQSSNFWSENTFTFEDGKNKLDNRLMRSVYRYICDRMESCKYRTEVSEEALKDLLRRLPDSRSSYEQLQQEQKEQARRLEEEAKLRAEKEQARLEELKKSISATGCDEQLKFFLEQAKKCGNTGMIRQLWMSVRIEETDITKEIGSKIESAFKVERMFGTSANNTNGLLKNLQMLIEN